MEAEKPARNTAWRKWVFGGMAAFALLTAACFYGTWKFGSSFSPAALDSRVEEIASAGYPVSLDDLRGETEPPANGANLVDAAHAALPPGSAELLDDRDYFAGERRDAAVAAVTNAEDVVDALDRALDCELIRFDAAVDDQYVELHAAHVERIEELVRFLQARTDLSEDYAHGTANVLPDIGRLLLLADKWVPLDADEAQWGVWVRNVALCLLRWELQAGRMDAAAVHQALGDLLPREHMPRFPAVVRTERIWDLRAVAYQVGSLDIEMRHPELNPDLVEARKTFQDPANVFLKSIMLRDALEYIDVVDALAEVPVESMPAHRRAVLELIAPRFDEGHVSLQLYLGHVENLHDDLVEVAALARIARIAVALLIERDATGSWPKSLDALASRFPDSGVPLNPYTDAPFTYEIGNEGVVLDATRGVDATLWNLDLDDVEGLELDALIWRLPHDDDE